VFVSTPDHDPSKPRSPSTGIHDHHPWNAHMGERCETLAAHVRMIVERRAELYRSREALKFSPYLLESWIEFQADFSRKIATS